MIVIFSLTDIYTFDVANISCSFDMKKIAFTKIFGNCCVPEIVLSLFLTYLKVETG